MVKKMNITRKKAMGLAVSVMIVIPLVVLLGCTIVFRLGVQTTLWGHFYLGNTAVPLTIEADYEDGHPIEDGLIDSVITKLEKVCDRPMVYASQYTNEIELPTFTFESGTENYVHYSLVATRNTAETWDTLYIVFTDKDYVVSGTSYHIAGFASPPGEVLIMMYGYTQHVEFYTLIHELGHIFGLEHCDSPGCYMNPILELNNLPTGFCSTCIGKLNEIRGYTFTGEGALILAHMFFRL
jgi:predicted Zn-dependent protease